MKKYIAPQLTVVSFKTERGFALSNPNITPESINEMFLMGVQEMQDGTIQDRSIEYYNEYNDWGSSESDNHFF